MGGLFCAALLASSPAHATDLLFVGGMGLTLRTMRLDGLSRPISGTTVGISGRVMMQVGSHLRLRVGVLTGGFEERDRTRVDRTMIGGAVEAVHHLGRDLYATIGSRVAGDHLVVVGTLADHGDWTRLVEDQDDWRLTVQPFATLGLRLRDRYHFELETGMAVAFDGEVSISYVVVFGVYFKMGRVRTDARDGDQAGSRPRQ